MKPTGPLPEHDDSQEGYDRGEGAEDEASRTRRRFLDAVGFEDEVQDGLKETGEKQDSALFPPVIQFYDAENSEDAHHRRREEKAREDELHGIEDDECVLGDEERKAENSRVPDAGRDG